MHMVTTPNPAVMKLSQIRGPSFLHMKLAGISKRMYVTKNRDRATLKRSPERSASSLMPRTRALLMLLRSMWATRKMTIPRGNTLRSNLWRIDFSSSRCSSVIGSGCCGRIFASRCVTTPSSVSLASLTTMFDVAIGFG